MQLLEIHTEEKQAQVVAALLEMGKGNKDYLIWFWKIDTVGLLPSSAQLVILTDKYC